MMAGMAGWLVDSCMDFGRISEIAIMVVAVLVSGWLLFVSCCRGVAVVL